jgi:(p)ppGpp synthase/HD superfamily hydrolase
MAADDSDPHPDARLGPRFVSAVEWASQLHDGQTRNGTEVPYLAHLLEVAALVLYDGGSESEAIAALLHDAIEDAGVRPKEIRRRFGRAVAKIVKACTETVDGELPAKAQLPRDATTWRRRKQEAVDHFGADGVAVPVLRVKGADALANARAIVAELRRAGPEVWRRFHAGAIDQLWYYRSVSAVLATRHPGPLSDELRTAVSEMEALSRWWFDVGDPQQGGH